jgi:putative addiction module killer protein
MEGLRDALARKRIMARLARLAIGLAGDAKPVGGGVVELRIDHGPGFRVYFVRRGSLLIMLLCGGDKSTQTRDITMAREIAADLENQDGNTNPAI